MFWIVASLNICYDAIVKHDLINISNLLLTSFEVSVNFYLYSVLYTFKEIPPYNGFGSLEDSLQSCLSLVPQPPKKDFIKMLENDNKVLRYEAVLVGCYSTGFCLISLLKYVYRVSGDFESSKTCL